MRWGLAAYRFRVGGGVTRSRDWRESSATCRAAHLHLGLLVEHGRAILPRNHRRATAPRRLHQRPRVAESSPSRGHCCGAVFPARLSARRAAARNPVGAGIPGSHPACNSTRSSCRMRRYARLFSWPRAPCAAPVGASGSRAALPQVVASARFFLEMAPSALECWFLCGWRVDRRGTGSTMSLPRGPEWHAGCAAVG